MTLTDTQEIPGNEKQPSNVFQGKAANPISSLMKHQQLAPLALKVTSRPGRQRSFTDVMNTDSLFTVTVLPCYRSVRVELGDLQLKRRLSVGRPVGSSPISSFRCVFPSFLLWQQENRFRTCSSEFQAAFNFSGVLSMNPLIFKEASISGG
ncbi:hypothetical protein CEXT_104751 [Caerostris extrusa]|uniref:Uncharacterized protein n=1 Tax=Caerostris extrusa TaxID=172846 RepID=A0AAV4VN46_CAEEX|nr:hypothetical protein CEXT_104751 [Caerostris extrusa]